MTEVSVLPSSRRDEDQQWRLYTRAMDILEGRQNGHARPILFALACRGFAPAQNLIGEFASPQQSLAWLRKAVAGGDIIARYNLAMEFLNRGNRQAYRHWLARAARTDPDALTELKEFRTRFPNPAVRKFGWFAPEADWRRRT